MCPVFIHPSFSAFSPLSFLSFLQTIRVLGRSKQNVVRGGGKGVRLVTIAGVGRIETRTLSKRTMAPP